MKVYNCKCGKMATWCNGAGDYSGYPFFCDDCVPRGCFCNDEYDDPEHNCSIQETIDWLDRHGSKWIWKEKDKSISRVDDQGRFLPCIEYSHQESGFETSEEENESLSKHGTEFSERQASNLAQYKKAEQELFLIREKNNGLESEEEDQHLDNMDLLWDKLSGNEIKHLNSYPDTSLIKDSPPSEDNVNNVDNVKEP